MPEKGDVNQPELVIIIDEAHLIFNEANKALLDQIETIVKLIRSKGIGIYFITQNPIDVPSGVLTSLGIGEALVTALNEKGIQTPLVVTMMRTPISRMDVLTENEIQEINANSKLVKKYRGLLDRESAYEILDKKNKLNRNSYC